VVDRRRLLGQQGGVRVQRREEDVGDERDALGDGGRRRERHEGLVGGVHEAVDRPERREAGGVGPARPLDDPRAIHPAHRVGKPDADVHRRSVLASRTAGSRVRPVSSDNLEDVPPWARALLDDARVARLGLLDADGHPRVLPVTYAVVAGAVWSAADDKPKRRPGAELARVRWLRRRPRAALTVDRYDDDWSRLAWVQVLGAVEVLEAAGQEAALDALAARYAPYRERRPGGPLLRLVPARVLWWRAG